MNAAIDTLAPSVCLTVEVINIAEGNPSPEALFDEAYGALDFALCLRSVSLADARRDAN
jgi:hypothetical protein